MELNDEIIFENNLASDLFSNFFQDVTKLHELSAVKFVSIWSSCCRRPEINTGLHRLDSLLNHKISTYLYQRCRHSHQNFAAANHSPIDKIFQQQISTKMLLQPAGGG